MNDKQRYIKQINAKLERIAELKARHRYGTMLDERDELIRLVDRATDIMAQGR